MRYNSSGNVGEMEEVGVIKRRTGDGVIEIGFSLFFFFRFFSFFFSRLLTQFFFFFFFF